MIGKRATFDMIEHQISVLSLGEYMIFCKDFDIPLDKVRCAKVYKTTATNSKEMYVDQFNESIEKLFIESK